MELHQLYNQFRKHSPFIAVGRNAELALDAARTLHKWNELESAGLVRLRMEPEEESYFDVFGCEDISKKHDQALRDTVDRLGCYWVTSEYLKCGTFEHADSIGMCVYENPLSPFENCYIIQLMAEAISQVTSK